LALLNYFNYRKKTPISLYKKWGLFYELNIITYL